MVERAEGLRSPRVRSSGLGNLGEIASGNPHDIAKATDRGLSSPTESPGDELSSIHLFLHDDHRITRLADLPGALFGVGAAGEISEMHPIISGFFSVHRADRDFPERLG